MALSSTPQPLTMDEIKRLAKFRFNLSEAERHPTIKVNTLDKTLQRRDLNLIRSVYDNTFYHTESTNTPSAAEFQEHLTIILKLIQGPTNTLSRTSSSSTSFTSARTSSGEERAITPKKSGRRTMSGARTPDAEMTDGLLDDPYNAIDRITAEEAAVAITGSDDFSRRHSPVKPKPSTPLKGTGGRTYNSAGFPEQPTQGSFTWLTRFFCCGKKPQTTEHGIN